MGARLPPTVSRAQHYMDRLHARTRSMGSTTRNIRAVVQLDLARLAYLFAEDDRTDLTFTLNTKEPSP